MTVLQAFQQRSATLVADPDAMFCLSLDSDIHAYIGRIAYPYAHPCAYPCTVARARARNTEFRPIYMRGRIIIVSDRSTISDVANLRDVPMAGVTCCLSVVCIYYYYVLPVV